MSAEIRFEGELNFLDVDVLSEALAEVDELFEVSDEELVSLLHESGAFDVRDLTVGIDVDIRGPDRWFAELQAMVETLVRLADDGAIAVTYDGEKRDGYVVE